MTTYLLTVRPLSVNRFSSFFELYDATMNVFNSIIRLVDANVLAFRFSDDPYYHIHAVIKTNGRIRYDNVHKIVPKGFHVHFALLKRKSDVENAKEYVLRHRPAHYVSVDSNVTFINRDGNKIVGGEEMSDVEERLERLEKTVEKLASVVEKLANGKTDETKTDNEPQSVSIDLGAINVTVQPARKGVALIIKFANYVKRNRNGAYYVALTPDEYRKLLDGLQSFNVEETKANGNGNENTNGRKSSRSGRNAKTRIKSKRGGEL